MKKFALGLIVGAVLTFSTSVFASNGLEQISAYLRQGLPISMDGKPLELEQAPIIYNGSTFVPLREIMQYMGKRVDWQGDRIELTSVTRNTAVTPDGKYVLEGQPEPTHWKDIDLTVGHQVDSPDYISYPNHSSVLSKEEVQIKSGKATLLKISHDNFTAATPPEQGTSKTDIIYMLYVTQPIAGDSAHVDTYFLSAKVSNDEAAAKKELLQVAETWNPLAIEAQAIIYDNTNHNFSIELPKSWEGKYDVVEDGNRITFFNKANKKAGAGGELFTIEIWSKEKWSTEGEELTRIIHLLKIGETGDRIFSFATPTDVQYSPDDEKLKAEYLSMSADIEHIKATFQIKSSS